MTAAVVDLVITEYPPAVTRALARHYEVIRKRIERIAGVPVRSRPYTQPGDLVASAVILSGSFAPWSRHDPDALAGLGDIVKRFDGPVLGICAGMQLQTIFAGGAIAPRERPAVGYGTIRVLDDADLLSGLGVPAVAYEHHSWDVVTLPDDFEVLASSEECPIEAVRARQRRWWGTQFHPERFTKQHPAGAHVLRNFLTLALAGSARALV